MKKYLILLATIVIMLSVSVPTYAATQPYMNKTSARLSKGNKVKLTVKNCKKKIKWTSSRPKWVPVSSTGVVRCKTKKCTTAYIHAYTTDGKYSFTVPIFCNINVICGGK